MCIRDRHIRFHDLRHTCASLLLANGVPMEQVKEWLGHSEISTTVDVYKRQGGNRMKEIIVIRTSDPDGSIFRSILGALQRCV